MLPGMPKQLEERIWNINNAISSWGYCTNIGLLNRDRPETRAKNDSVILGPKKE
jgi:hypothetical protein